ncbi:hypothetical protein MPER_08857 [Moniliophthora perniciosa FA553]|nr:hypothetical protein MPER_08857 [Moniliophthora perniciosa FA553]
MVCPECGDEPENIIWDGVTLAFGRKHVTDTLRPPTYEHPTAAVRNRKYPVKPQWLPAPRNARPIRHRIIKWLRASTSSRGKAGGVDVEDGDDRAEKECESGPVGEDLPSLVSDLLAFAPELGSLFKRVFLSGNEKHHQLNTKLRRRYVTLFEQLGAEESAVQMVNEPALNTLQHFVDSPSERNASRLVDVPALLAVLEGEMQIVGEYTPELVAVCRWMANRASEVLTALKMGQLPLLPTISCEDGVEDWQKVCPVYWRAGGELIMMTDWLLLWAASNPLAT